MMINFSVLIFEHDHQNLHHWSLSCAQTNRSILAKLECLRMFFSDESLDTMRISPGQTESDLPSLCDVASNCPVRRIFFSVNSSPISIVFLSKLVVNEQHQTREIQELYNKVNQLTNDKSHRRLFAVIQLGNEQRKVTTEDIICKVDEFHPTIGDRIRFEKVLFSRLLRSFSVHPFAVRRCFSWAVQISPWSDDHFSVHTSFVSKESWSRKPSLKLKCTIGMHRRRRKSATRIIVSSPPAFSQRK